MDAQSFVKRLGDLSHRCNHLLLHCRGVMAWDRGGIIADGLEVLTEIDNEAETLLEAAFGLDGGVDVLALIDHLQALRQEIEQASFWVRSLVIDAGRLAADDTADADAEVYHRAETLTDSICRRVLTNTIGDYARRLGNRLKLKPVQGGGDKERLTKEALALAALASNPSLSDEQVAEIAGCARTSLYRFKKYVIAREALNSGRRDFTRGQKYRRTVDEEGSRHVLEKPKSYLLDDDE